MGNASTRQVMKCFNLSIIYNPKFKFDMGALTEQIHYHLLQVTDN